MRFWGNFFALLWIFIFIREIWVSGEAPYGGIKAVYKGQFIPTAIFEDNSKAGRLETIICPKGEFLTPSRVCLKPEDFMHKKIRKPKMVETMVPKENERKKDRMAKKCEEVSTVAPKVNHCEKEKFIQ